MPGASEATEQQEGTRCDMGPPFSRVRARDRVSEHTCCPQRDGGQVGEGAGWGHQWSSTSCWNVLFPAPAVDPPQRAVAASCAPKCLSLPFPGCSSSEMTAQ